MTIVELHLDRPAFKRVEATPETASEIEGGTESKEIEIEESEGGGGLGRRLLLLAVIGTVAFVAMRRMRSGPEQEAAIDIGTEETRPETE